MASFVREKPMPIFFPNSFRLTLSTPSQEGYGSISQWRNNAKGTTMPGTGPLDFIFQRPLKPEGGPEGDTNNVFSKEDRVRQQFSPRLT